MATKARKKKRPMASIVAARKRAKKRLAKVSSHKKRSMRPMMSMSELDIMRMNMGNAKFARYFKKLTSGKSRVTKKKVRKNPAPLLFVITAKGTGKKMHFDGTKFSERARVSTFPTLETAQRKALDLVKKYPVLRKYRIAIEDSRGPKA